MMNQKIYANEIMTDEQLDKVNGGGLSGSGFGGGRAKNWIKVAKVITKIVIKAIKDYNKTS